MNKIHLLAHPLLPVLLLGSLAFGSPPPAQAEIDRAIDTYVRAHAETGGFMGTVLVARGDDLLFERGYGFADLEHRATHAPDTVFRLGSLTKGFTAAAIVQLEAQGLLQLDDPVSKHLPDLPGGERFTIHELLTHTAGLPDYTSLPGFDEVQRGPVVLDDLLASIAALPLEFEPGSRFAYSNSGYVVLTKIIEVVSGRAYGDYLREHLLGPLDLETIGPDDEREVVPGRARGYMPTSDGYRHAAFSRPAAASGAGALRGTAGDLIRWANALSAGELGGSISLESMLAGAVVVDRERSVSYGYGWFREGQGDQSVVYHGGATEGFLNALAVHPAADLTVVVLSNVGLSPSLDMARDLIAIVLGDPYELPRPREVISVAPDVLARYVGRYQLMPDLIAEVSLQEGHLFIDPGGEGRYQLHAESEREFFLREGDVQVTFVQGEDGTTVTGLIFTQAGRAVPAERLD